MSNRGANDRIRGVNLVEVLLAISVLAVATLALLSVRTFSLQAQQKTQERQTATALALEVMTEAEAKIEANFEVDLGAGYTHDTSAWPDGFTHTLTQQFDSPELQSIEVMLFWTDRNGPQEYRLWTKFAKSLVP